MRREFTFAKSFLFLIFIVIILAYLVNGVHIKVNSSQPEEQTGITRTGVTIGLGYLTVYTDKPYYLPNEIVHISGEAITPGITWTYSGYPFRGLIVEIQIFDPNNVLIHTGTSNPNGVVYKKYAYHYSLGDNPLIGAYRIYARLLDPIAPLMLQGIDGEGNFNVAIYTTKIRSLNSTIFTPPAYVKVIPDKPTYSPGEKMRLAGEANQSIPSWITTTWAGTPALPAKVEMKNPLNESVYETTINIFYTPPAHYFVNYSISETFTGFYTLSTTAQTGEYVIIAYMTPEYVARYYIIEEKVVSNGMTSTIARIYDTRTTLVASYSTTFTVIDEFPTTPIILAIALTFSMLAFSKLRN